MQVSLKIFLSLRFTEAHMHRSQCCVHDDVLHLFIESNTVDCIYCDVCYLLPLPLLKRVGKREFAMHLNSMIQIKKLTGQHALITGGTHGIGFAVAQALLEYGAKVTITSRNISKLEQAASQLSAYGEVDFIELDVTRSLVPDAFEAAATRLGPISILINNVGHYEEATFNNTDWNDFDAMLSANLSGVIRCTKAALPVMLKIGWGRVVNISSTAGLTGYSNTPTYCAAKHAVVGLTRSLALEVARNGVTVNAICPGYTETEAVQQAIAQTAKTTRRSREDVYAEWASNNPQGRLVQVQEVAHAVAWLCMPGASAINGQAILVDGGELIA